MIIDIPKEQFEMLGLQLAGHSIETIQETCKRTNDNRLEDYCYAGAATLRDLFRDIQDPTLGAFTISKPDPAKLIYALYFLKEYPTAHDFAARCVCGTGETVLESAWRYIKAIQAVKSKKIKWIFDDADLYNGGFFIASVDGVQNRNRSNNK